MPGAQRRRRSTTALGADAGRPQLELRQCDPQGETASIRHTTNTLCAAFRTEGQWDCMSSTLIIWIEVMHDYGLSCPLNQCPIDVQTGQPGTQSLLKARGGRSPLKTLSQRAVAPNRCFFCCSHL